VPAAGAATGEGEVVTLVGARPAEAAAVQPPKMAPPAPPGEARPTPKGGARPNGGSEAAAAQPGGPASVETIDLGVALRLAGVENPTINLAQERVRESLALLLGARSLLLPSMNVGGNYHNHSGLLQPSFGVIRAVNSQSLFFGFGARTLAAESVAFPGIRLFAHLGDAIYEPLAARQVVASRRSEAQAVQNDILLRVATAYVALVGAEARLEVLRRGEGDVAEVVRLTAAYAQKGQGRQADADRAAGRAALIREEAHRAEEEVAVASAELSRLLALDPSTRLRTPGGPVLPIPIVPEGSDLESLVAEGLRNRPELYARSAEVQAARYRVRQEQTRPLLPLLSVGFSAGGMGGGSNLVPYTFGHFGGRTDFDVMAVWTGQNLGFGNLARVRQTEAQLRQAVADYDLAVNRVRREVSEALAGVKAASREIELARQAAAVAEEGFRLERDRIQLGQGLPIEVLDSFRQSVNSRQRLVAALTAYNESQFRLFVALGSNPLATPTPEPAPAAPPPMVPPVKP
jgi:outer membrane protein TolC